MDTFHTSCDFTGNKKRENRQRRQCLVNIDRVIIKTTNKTRNFHFLKTCVILNNIVQSLTVAYRSLKIHYQDKSLFCIFTYRITELTV